MTGNWERHVKRWQAAGLIDSGTAAAIRAFESGQAHTSLRWPVWLAIGLGVLLLGTGLLLFVAANWDRLAPGGRFGLVLALVGGLHGAAAVAGRGLPALASGLHALGTVALGAGIFLAGQIFNLQEHWPGGLLLWSLGAWGAWWLLRDAAHTVFVALLTPAWLSGECFEAIRQLPETSLPGVVAVGWLLLAVTYLTAVYPGHMTPGRRALRWVGGVAVFPATLAVVMTPPVLLPPWGGVPGAQFWVGWLSALGLPLALAGWLRGRQAWLNGLATVWAVLLSLSVAGVGQETGVAVYALCAAGALGLIAWGLAESRVERVNLGVAGFALTVLAFYVSSVMDKLGRSASLIALGLLFLAGGWLLERLRRRLVAGLSASRSGVAP